MRIAIMGTGGMGGYLGAKLATGGHDVVLVARGEHLTAIRSHGLRVAGVEPMTVRPVNATDDPSTAGVADGVLFCVKLYDTESAAAAMRAMLADHTWVLTVQNGVDGAARIDSVLGAGRTLAGAAYFPANITAPGEITYLGKIGPRPHLLFGEPGAGASARAHAVRDALVAAGLEAEVCADTEAMLWEKFCLMAGTSAATGLTRQNVGTVRRDPDMRWLLEQAVAEAARVGRARGVALDPGVEARTLAAIDGNPAGGKASLLVDLERGRRLELDGLSGTVVRLGRELGVDTPVHRVVHAGLKAFAGGT